MALPHPEAHFQGGNYFQGINGPFGKMAGIKAATASIIAPKHAVCLFRKLALKWGFMRSISMLSFLALFSWEVERTLFYVFQNLKPRYQGSQEAFSAAGIRPSNCGPGGLNTPDASILTLAGLSCPATAISSVGSPQRIGASQIPHLPLSPGLQLFPKDTCLVPVLREVELCSHIRFNKHFMNLPKTPLSCWGSCLPSYILVQFSSQPGRAYEYSYCIEENLGPSKMKPALIQLLLEVTQ